MNTKHRPLIFIPHYQHLEPLSAMLDELKTLELPILIIDDGSPKNTQNALKNLKTPQITLLLNPQNQGKGAITQQGLKWAQQQNFSHTIQIDADGQHQIQDIPKLLQKSIQHPQALICAEPIYGEDAPKSRLYGRKISNFWCAIHTQSRAIKDSMCGFRLYPLQEIIPIIETAALSPRMAFDIEILVYAHWHNIAIHWQKSPVRYPDTGQSHFTPIKSNLEISKAHSRLFFKMLLQKLKKPL